MGSTFQTTLVSSARDQWVSGWELRAVIRSCRVRYLPRVILVFAAQLQCCVYRTHRSATGAMCCASSYMRVIMHAKGGRPHAYLYLWMLNFYSGLVLIDIQYQMRETWRLRCIIDVENGRDSRPSVHWSPK
ncbi:hypothetical protein P692DRAFT_20738136 [Suillus brevipes Sb2]|nr:hypothetical protein P692DRAFT_20738136 [Suillus brevipes Sb2]